MSYLDVVSIVGGGVACLLLLVPATAWLARETPRPQNPPSDDGARAAEPAAEPPHA